MYSRSLAAISTLYFVEHVKQNDWYHQTFRHYDNGNGLRERQFFRNGSTDNELSSDIGHGRSFPMRNNTGNLKDNAWTYAKKKNHDTQLNVTAPKLYPLTESKSFDNANDFTSNDANRNKVLPSPLTTPEDLEKEKPIDFEPNARKYHPTIEETLENVIVNVKEINDTLGQMKVTEVTSKKSKDSGLDSRDYNWTNNSTSFNELESNLIDDGTQNVLSNKSAYLSLLFFFKLTIVPLN